MANLCLFDITRAPIELYRFFFFMFNACNSLLKIADARIHLAKLRDEKSSGIPFYDDVPSISASTRCSDLFRNHNDDFIENNLPSEIDDSNIPDDELMNLNIPTTPLKLCTPHRKMVVYKPHPVNEIGIESEPQIFVESADASSESLIINDVPQISRSINYVDEPSEIITVPDIYRYDDDGQVPRMIDEVIDELKPSDVRSNDETIVTDDSLSDSLGDDEQIIIEDERYTISFY